MKDLIFYKDTTIGREIAFVLDIKFRFIDNIDKKSLRNYTLFVLNEEEKKIAIDLELKHNTEYVTLEDLYEFLDSCSRINRIVDTNDIKEINNISNTSLSLSQLLIKVLYSRPRDIECEEPLLIANIDSSGNVWGCCPHWVEIPFSNVLIDDDIYWNYYSRIIKLSVINKTYCFCDLTSCKYYGRKYLNNYKPTNFDVLKYPSQLVISIDKTCNLKCNSCRKDFYIATEEEKAKTSLIADKLIEKGLLEKSCIFIAGDGEVFLSKNYDRILRSINNGKEVRILTNGVLFTEDKWNFISDRFKIIDVSVSIDAATKETYNKLRHGPFLKLLKNLEMLGNLRKEKKISKLSFNFVVQRSNMHEMKDFIKLGKKYNADKIQFTKLNDWGSMGEEDYLNECLIVDDYLDYDLYEIFKDPIFKIKKPIIDISSFKQYIEKSMKHYKD